MDPKSRERTVPLPVAQTLLLPGLALWAILLLAGGAAVAATADAPAPQPASESASAAPANPSGAHPAAPADRPAAQAAVQPAPPAAVDDLERLLGEPPTRVRVAILNATGKPGGANKIAVLLSEVKRRALEDQIGLQIEVVNLSTAENGRAGQSVLFYRPEFLRAALAMAKAIPGEQFVQPMRPADLKRAGVDVEIVVGKELP